MAQTSVSSCVLSIVASFTNGLDVFRRFREARGKRRGSRKAGKNASGKKEEEEAEEIKLVRSLRQGPEDIGREYARSVGTVGDAFAGGDVVAQTCLAEILLRLNTGLVTIIHSFLDRRGGNDGRLDYSELTRISDRSRIETCRTLRALLTRMVRPRAPPISYSSEDIQHSKVVNRRSDADGVRRKQRPVASPKHTRVRGPMLARVVIADSTKPSQVALVRPGERRKKPRSSSNAASSKVQSTASLVSPTYASPPNNDETVHSQLSPKPHHSFQTHRRPSAMDVAITNQQPKRSPLRKSQSTPRLEKPIYEHEPLPLVSNTATPPPFEPRRRKTTPTYYSIDTTSTQLGEIPLHKWAEPYDFDAMSRLNREAEHNGWPITEMDQTQIRKKKGLGIFRMFRKKRAET